MSLLGDVFGSGGLFGSGGIIGGLFGNDTSGTTNSNVTAKTSTTGATTKVGTEKEYLAITEAGLNKIVADVLGGANGLADIFSEQGSAGLYSSSVASQAAGDLVTNLAGELAKLTAKQVKEYNLRETANKKETATSRTRGTTSTEQAGLFDQLFG